MILRVNISFSLIFRYLTCLFSLMIFLHIPIYSQPGSTSLINFNNSDYPYNHSDFFAFDGDGNVIKNLNNLTLKLTENGITQDILSLNCSLTNNFLPLSTVIALDVSASMSGNPASAAKTVAETWINMMDPATSECGIIGFNHLNYLLKDLTADKNALRNSIAKISLSGSSDFSAALVNKPAGALRLIEKGRPDAKKIIIIISDGLSTVNADEVINTARNLNVAIYPIILNLKASREMEEIAGRTGGYLFENVKSAEEAAVYARVIRQLAYGNQPCNIVWLSNICNIFRNVKIEINDFFACSHEYSILKSKLARFDFLPSNALNFGVVAPGSKISLPLSIIARNDSLRIENITLKSPFSIISYSKQPPFTLKKDEECKLQIEFEPQDTNYIYKELIIISDACSGTKAFLSGGISTNSSDKKTLSLISPNGGEILIGGSDTSITWSGILPSDTLSLSLSSDAGRTWNIISDNAANHDYLWKVPKFESEKNSCLVKARRQSRGSNNIIFLKAHIGAIKAIAWNPTRNELLSGCDGGLLISWDIENGKPNDTLSSNINAFNALDISPDGQLLATSSGSQVLIWRYSGGKWRKFTELETSEQEFICLKWSPDGFYLAGGSKSGQVAFWEPLNKPQIASLQAHELQVTSLDWHRSYPSMPYLLSSGREGKVKILDVRTFSGIKFLDSITYSGQVNSAAWSPDGSLIALSGSGGIIQLWTYPDLKKETDLTGHEGDVMALAWSQDGRYLASGGADKYVILWTKQQAWEIYYKYRGHTDNISVLAWNKSGTKQLLSSGSFDSWIEVWSPDDIPIVEPVIQEDISDNVFSIVNPSCKIKDIYFGQVKIGRSKEMNIPDFLGNTGKVPIRIDSIVIHDDSAGEFNFYPPDKYLIQPKDSSGIKLKINAKTAGKKNSHATVFFYSDSIRANIIGDVTEPELLIFKNLVDFGKVTLNRSKLFDTVFVKNISQSQIKIDSIRNFGPDRSQFRIVLVNGGEYSGKDPIIMQPGGEMSLRLEYFPVTTGRTAGGIAFYYSGLNGDYLPQLQLFGEGIDFTLDVPPSLTFPPLICNGQKLLQLITLKNIGSDTITISGVKITGAQKDEFSLEPGLIGKKIDPGDSLNHLVNYDPKSRGRAEAILEIDSYINPDEEKSVRVYLSGLVDYYEYSPDKNTLDFGVFPVPGIYKETIKMKNTGTLPEGFKCPVAVDEFSIDSIDIAVINPQQEATLYCTFAPTQSGDFEAKFDFKDSCNKNYSITFKGSVKPRFAILSTDSIVDYNILACSGESKDTIILLRNTGNDALEIRDIKFLSQANQNGNFVFPDLINLPYIIQPESSYSLKVSFRPVSYGEIHDTISIISNAVNAKNDSSYINLSGYRDNISLIPNLDTLKFLDIREGQADTKSVEVQNPGRTAFLLALDSSGLSRFGIESVNPGKISGNGGKSVINVLFKGGQPGNKFDEKFALIDTCGNQYEVYLAATVAERLSVTLATGSICGFPGDTLEIPVILKNPQNYNLSGLLGFEFKLRFKDYLLKPIGNTPPGILQNGERIIDINLPYNGSDTLLAKIQVKVTALFTDSTDLSVDSPASLGINLNINTAPGKFVAGCGEDINFPIGQAGNLKLYQNYPDPADQYITIVYEIFEDDDIELILYNYQAKELYPKVLDIGRKKAGKYVTLYNISEFSQGIYILALQNKTHRLTAKVRIIR